MTGNYVRLPECWICERETLRWAYDANGARYVYVPAPGMAPRSVYACSAECEQEYRRLREHTEEGVRWAIP